MNFSLKQEDLDLRGSKMAKKNWFTILWTKLIGSRCPRTTPSPSTLSTADIQKQLDGLAIIIATHQSALLSTEQVFKFIQINEENFIKGFNQLRSYTEELEKRVKSLEGFANNQVGAHYDNILRTLPERMVFRC
jgi:hypothetical protein